MKGLNCFCGGKIIGGLFLVFESKKEITNLRYLTRNKNDNLQWKMKISNEIMEW